MKPASATVESRCWPLSFSPSHVFPMYLFTLFCVLSSTLSSRSSLASSRFPCAPISVIHLNLHLNRGCYLHLYPHVYLYNTSVHGFVSRHLLHSFASLLFDHFDLLLRVLLVALVIVFVRSPALPSSVSPSLSPTSFFLSIRDEGVVASPLNDYTEAA